MRCMFVAERKRTPFEAGQVVGGQAPCAILIVVLTLVGFDAAPSPLGPKIVELARSKLGQKVGDGECTALVADVLRTAGAKLDGVRNSRVAWGDEIRSVKDAQPGDILQLDNAVFVRSRLREDGALVTLTFKYPHHTAIVSGVKKRRGRVVLTVLHQNAGAEGGDEAVRKVVQEWTVNLAELRRGRLKVYRPRPE